MIIPKLVKVLIAFVSLVGVLLTVGHYLPLPEDIQEGRNYPAPGKEWFVDQLKLYSDNAILGAMHVVPSMVLMLLIPVQISSRVRNKFPFIHRYSGRVLLLMIVIIALSSIALSLIMPFGNWSEAVGAVTISIGCLVCLVGAFYHIKQRNILAHRVWMSYMLAFALSPISMRPVFAIGIDGFGLDGRDIFGVCMFIGLAINLALVKWWLGKSSRYTSSSLPNHVV